MEGGYMAEEKPSARESEDKPAERKPVKVDNVVIYRDRAGEWRWKARSKNNKIVAESGEGYRNRPWARRVALELYPDARVVWGPK
jgi:hypothetical protein